MDIVTRESVKILNSVIICGLTMTEVELQSYLETNGSVNRVDPDSEFHGNAMV